MCLTGTSGSTEALTGAPRRMAQMLGGKEENRWLMMGEVCVWGGGQDPVHSPQDKGRGCICFAASLGVMSLHC